MKNKLNKIALCSSILLMTACVDKNISKVKNYPLNNSFSYGQSIDSAEYCKKVRWSSVKDDYGRWKVTAKCSFVISPKLINEDIEKARISAQTENLHYYESISSNISVYKAAIKFYPTHRRETAELEKKLNSIDEYSDEAREIKERLREMHLEERRTYYSFRDFFNNDYLDVESDDYIDNLTKKLDNLIKSKDQVGRFIEQERKKYIKSLDKFKKDIPGEKEHIFLITNNGDVKLEQTRIVIGKKEIAIGWDFATMIMMDLHRPNSGYFLKEASRFVLPKKFGIYVSCENNGICTGKLN